MTSAALLLLADSRLPAGGHAHSGGLEAAVAAGRVTDVESLDGFLRGRLATAGAVAAAFAAAAASVPAAPTSPACAPTSAVAPTSPAVPAAAVSRDHGDFSGSGHGELSVITGGAAACPAASHDHGGFSGSGHGELSVITGGVAGVAGVGGAAGAAGAAGLGELDDGYDARTPSPVLRRVSRQQGRALLRAGRAMWPVPPTRADPHQPVALGIVAAAAGLSPRDAALAAAYAAITGPASAAVRLLGLDPYPVQALLAALAPACDDTAALAARQATGPIDELPAHGAPLLDIGAEVHASWEVRLFAS
jgi:urease accessory protein